MDDAAILQLPNDPVLLKRIIAQREQVIGQQDSALALIDVHIEELQRNAAAALAEREAAIAARAAEVERLKRDSDAAIAQRDAAIAEREAQIEQIKREAAEQLEAQKQRHKAELDAVLRRFYGPHSERFDPTQLLLFGLKVVEEAPANEKAVQAESGQKPHAPRINHHNHHKHGRRELPAHLPRVEIPHDLTDEQKKCPCCGEARVCIGAEISEQLEFIAASFEVLKHVRNKYACKTCGEGCEHCDGSPHIEIAVKEAQPIEKGLPGPGLLAHVIVSKLGDHLPLYRLEKIFHRVDVDISRSTMCAWMMNCGGLVKPLVDLMTKRVKLSKVIHTDDTRVPVQDETIKGKCKSGRMWTYIGDEDNPYVVFDYTPDRTRAGPQTFLADYKGHLQADAYGGYDGVYTRGNVTEVACWAHGRRKFFDARETDGRRAAQMLRFVQRLYAVERRIKIRVERRLEQNPSLTADERHEIIRAARQARSAPILKKIKTWLDAEQKLVLPRSPMAAAIGYMLNQWAALCVYVTAGFLNIDNNAAERALKRIAIGRKNWLFAGNDAAARSHARLYTLLAGAERHGLNPQEYLTSVLAKIGQTPLSQLEQFLPDVWKREAQATPPRSGRKRGLHARRRRRRSSCQQPPGHRTPVPSDPAPLSAAPPSPRLPPTPGPISGIHHAEAACG
jgi:transposase